MTAANARSRVIKLEKALKELLETADLVSFDDCASDIDATAYCTARDKADALLGVGN